MHSVYINRAERGLIPSHDKQEQVYNRLKSQPEGSLQSEVGNVEGNVERK